MTNIIFEAIRVLVLSIWAIVGMIFWLPFLIRMIAFFTSSILVSVGGKTDMSVAKIGLDKAVRFYPDGFNHIQESINDLIHGKANEKITWSPMTDFWGPLLEQVIFAFLFWGISILAYMKLFL